MVSLLITGCTPDRNFDARLKAILQPYIFSITEWESKAIPEEISNWLLGGQEEIGDEIRVVTEYFAAIERIKNLKSEIGAANADSGEGDLNYLQTELNGLQERKRASAGMVEKIIEKQIRDTLTELGIFNPLAESEFGFPPVNFKLEKPPHLLVISPRDKIESMREITLKPSTVLAEIEDIEGRIDDLDVSSLVVELGGLGATYPTFVTDEAKLKFTIEITTEEWLHQYLVFKPLGFRYLLDLTGLSRDYEIATMNETLAGMVSKEIGSIVYEKYYPENENGADQSQAAESEFDFDREMREIRKTVDAYLAQGEIKQAEEFMEQKRQYLASMGHYIRKLNQAYFAFHGTYADKPAFISPIGVELKQLRSQSDSLKDFLNTVAAMTSRQDLADSVTTSGAAQ